MCGIAVTVDLLPDNGATGAIDALQSMQTMVDRLRSRGPDDASIVCIRPATPSAEKGVVEVVLGHTRLAIVGGPAAKSPFTWKKRSGTMMTLIHNGEIYNHVELKNQLVQEGCCDPSEFQTDCDSEVLLACCAIKGFEWTMPRIRGMFAFLAVEWTSHHDHDNEKEQYYPAASIRNVVAARDTFGIKPLCYAVDDRGKRIVFASQVLAIDPSGFDGSIKIKDIIPGSYVEYTFQERQPLLWTSTAKTYSFIFNDFDSTNILPGYRIECLSSSSSLDDDDSIDNLREKLVNAVKSRIPPPGSVKTAVLLSGGLDSSLITSIASRLMMDNPLHTFNISYHEEVGTDQEYARTVQAHLPNVYHEEVTFTFNEGFEALPEVIDCLETYDPAMVRAGVPLYILSKRIQSLGFKVILCGEGADEVFGGYRLFEDFLPWTKEGQETFSNELCRRLQHIDTSELQRVDRCTSAHGLEARVPFLDIELVSCAMKFPSVQKMSHVSLGYIQKYILRRAFSTRQKSDDFEPPAWLPDSVLFREKEQLADGIGRGWIRAIQAYAIESESMEDGEEAEKALYKRMFLQTNMMHSVAISGARLALVCDRHLRRRQGTTKPAKAGKSQPCRWHPVSKDKQLAALEITKADANQFLSSVLGWPADCCLGFTPTLNQLNKLITSMLERVPFHNLTLLLRERRPPTVKEIKDDMMSGLGGPCSVVNTFFAALLVTLGFGPHVYLLSCEINGRFDCHVAILVQIKGLRYFVDVANAKPYSVAVHLGDTSIKKSLNGSFEWSISYNTVTKRMEVLHFGKAALSFDPSVTVRFRSFRQMIQRSRNDPSFGPFLTGLRFCLYSKGMNNETLIKAVRDIRIYDGKSSKDVTIASKKDEINLFAAKNFGHILGFSSLVEEALLVLDREYPTWFEASTSSEANLKRNVYHK